MIARRVESPCCLIIRIGQRSYWIPGSYAPTLSENRDSFLRLLKNNDFKEEKMTKVGLLRHRQLHVPGIQQEPDPFIQQEEA